MAVLAGVSPIGAGGDNFGFMSGTSMAAPHVAGFGALILGKNPNWSPAAVKSAMMTTAGDINADGSKNTDVHATGAGQVDPGTDVDPGLVYDADGEDYLRFIQGTGRRPRHAGLGSTKPRDMNVPSFSLGNLAGKIEVTRTVTALTPGVYRAKASVPGIKVTVTPSILNFSAPARKRTFKVSFENQNAHLGQFAMGSLIWQGANKTVTSPIAVRPQSVVAPKNVALTSEAAPAPETSASSPAPTRPSKMTLDGLSKADSSAVELVPGPFTVRADASNFVKTVRGSRPVPRWPSSRSSRLTRPRTSTCVVVTPGCRGDRWPRRRPANRCPSPTRPPATYTIYANLYASPNGQATKASVDAAVLGANESNATSPRTRWCGCQRRGRQGHAELDGPEARAPTSAGSRLPVPAHRRSSASW